MHSLLQPTRTLKALITMTCCMKEIIKDEDEKYLQLVSCFTDENIHTMQEKTPTNPNTNEYHNVYEVPHLHLDVAVTGLMNRISYVLPECRDPTKLNIILNKLKSSTIFTSQIRAGDSLQDPAPQRAFSMPCAGAAFTQTITPFSQVQFSFFFFSDIAAFTIPICCNLWVSPMLCFNGMSNEKYARV